jgi:hypothetical protein
LAARNCFGLLLIISLFSCKIIYAQQAKDSSNKVAIHSLLKIKISWNCGPEWEKRLGKASSINFFGGLVLATSSDGFSLSNIKDKWILEPDAYAEYRNYYNFYRRNTKGKKTGNNSANFIFGRAEAYFPVKNQNFFNLLFIEGWGAQRSLCRKLSIDCHAGIVEHFYYDKPPHGGFNYVLLEPFVNFSIMYVF